MTFYVVTSVNRHAVRKLLTAAGDASAMVRVLRNGQLGQRLHDLVEKGTITVADAQTAIGSNDPVTDTSDAVDADAPVNGMGSAPAARPDANKAIDVLRSLLAPDAPHIDASQIAALVKAELAKQVSRPSVIEIRSDAKTVTLNGEYTHACFENVVKTISTRVAGRRLHVWLAGPSGSGKSFIGFQAAKALGLPYYGVGAIQSKYDLIGYKSPSGDDSTLRTPLRQAVEFGGVFGFDDVDASDPRAVNAFNELLANGRYAFPDKVVEAHADFVCVASANTWGMGATADYVGRNKIDGATLTRFVRINVGYDEKLETDLVGGHDWAKFVQAIRACVVKEGIKVIISPRHTLQGVGLLSAGIPRKDVESMTVFAGLDADTVKRLRSCVRDTAE